MVVRGGKEIDRWDSSGRACGWQESPGSELFGTWRSQSLRSLGPRSRREHFITTDFGSQVLTFVPASPGPQTRTESWPPTIA